MKKLLVCILSLLMVASMTGLFVTSLADESSTDVTVLKLDEAFSIVTTNNFSVAVSPALSTWGNNGSEYELEGYTEALKKVEIYNGTETKNATHFRNEPSTGGMLKIWAAGMTDFIDFAQAAAGCTVTFKAGITFIDQWNNAKKYSLGDEDIVYTCEGNGVWKRQIKSEELTVLTPADTIEAGDNNFRITVSPSLYTANELEYDIKYAPCSAIELFNGTGTANVTHFRNEPTTGKLLFYNTNGFMAFNVATESSTITIKAGTVFCDHVNFYTFGNKDVIYECAGDGIWTRKDENEIPEKFTTSVLSESEVNLPAYGDNSISFENDKIAFNLTKDTTQNISSYDASVTLNRIYKGDFTAEFTVRDKSSGHTGDRFLIFAVGESNSFMYLPYQNNNVYLLNGSNYDAALGNSLHSQAISGDLTVKFQRVGDELTLYLNGEKFGDTQQYTAKTAKFTVKARRLVVEVSDISVLGTQAAAPVSKVWTSEDFADSEINVPEFESNSITVGENKLCINLSNNAKHSDFTKQATVSFNKKYQDDFTLEFNVDYKSTNYAQTRYLMVTFGSSYSLVFIPSYAQVHLIGGVEFNTGATHMNMSDAELSAASIKVVRTGNNMTFYINGSQFGTTQSYTEEFVKIGVKAHRVIADIINFKVTGTEYVEPVEEYTYWTSEDFANSVIKVPSYGENKITTTNDMLGVDLSNDVSPSDFSYEASVAFKKQYKGDFTLKYTIEYLSTGNSDIRYLMVTVGDSYALMLCPYNANVQLLASTTYDTARKASVGLTANVAEYSIKRIGDKLYFYVNGNQLGDPQDYTDELVSFGVKAHRVTANVKNFGIIGEEYIAPVDPDEGKVFVNWGSEDFADSVIRVPEYEGNAITTDGDKVNVNLSVSTVANTDAYDSSITFNKKYQGDYTLEFTMEYISTSHKDLRYAMFVAGEYGIAYCPYCEKVHVYKGEEYHVGENLLKETEFKNVTEFRFRIVAQGNKITLKVNDTELGTYEKTEDETIFAIKGRRTVFEIRDFKISGEAVVPADEASTDVFRFVAATGIKTPAMIINRNLGSNAFVLENVNSETVSYVTASGETKTLKSVNYSLNGAADLTPALLFRFDGEPTVGDVLTVKAGFSFTLNENTVQTVKTYKATYTADGWSAYYIEHGDITVAAGTVKVGNVASPDSVLVNFGIKGVSGGESYFVDGTSGWYNYDQTKAGARVFDKFEGTADYVRGGSRLTVRYALMQGVFAFVGISEVKAGDVIVLRKGLTVYEGDKAKQNYDANIIFEETSYAPVFVLGENLVYVYDGTNFVKANAATDANITNAEELNNLHVGSESHISWSINSDSYDYPKFSSSDETIATVDTNGNVKALKEGEVTFVLKFANITRSITVTVAKALEKTGIEYKLKAYATKGDKQYIVAYLNEALNISAITNNVIANWIYEGDVKGLEFEVTEDMINLDNFDNSKVGETYITIENEGISVDIPVYVYEVQTVEDVKPSRLSGWNEAINVYFADSIGGSDVIDVKSVNVIEHPEYGISQNMVTLRIPALDAATKYAFHTIGQVTNLQCILFFNGFNASDKDSIVVGTVLSLGKDFRFYRYIDGTFVAAYKFKNSVEYVWTGSEWAFFEADATEVTVKQTSVTLPVGAVYDPEITVLPEGSYYKPSVQVEGDALTIENGKVKAVAAGKATVYVVYGSRKIAIDVTVVEKEIQNIVLSNNRVFNISAGGTLDLSKIKVCADYGDGMLSEEIALNAEIAEFTLDTSVAGKHTITIAVTLGGKTFDVNVSVAIHEVEEVYPDNIACLDDDGWFMGNAIGIFFSKTFNNMANVYPTDIGEDGYKMKDYVKFIRDGKALEIKGHAFLTYIYTIIPVINGDEVSSYKVGDQIILQRGMCFYKWFGNMDANNVPIGEGDFVKVGELKYDMTFTYNENHKFYLVIPAENGELKEETVSIGLGETHGTNVVTVPSYASDAEWFFTSSDAEIVSVNADGLLKGLKIGSATITATLKKVSGETIKTLTFSVTVTDSVQSIKITANADVTVKKGWQFDYSELQEKYGIKAEILMASGAIGDEVSLADARITGYDPDKTGEQIITFRIYVNGKSVTGELKIMVEDTATGCSKGCASSTGFTSAFILVALLAVVTIIRKKGAYND